MVKIRLKRVGKRKQPSYRVVVADSRSPRDGRIIESIGHYQPLQDPSIVAIDSSRAVHWLERGAQPSPPVRKLLEISGAWAEFTGQAPPAPADSRRKATPAESVTAPAASVGEGGEEASDSEVESHAAGASEQDDAGAGQEPTS